MKHDPFEFFAPDMTWMQRAWRVAALVAVVVVLLADVFVWRP
jgi:hypothetical protein